MTNETKIGSNEIKSKIKDTVNLLLNINNGWATGMIDMTESIRDLPIIETAIENKNFTVQPSIMRLIEVLYDEANYLDKRIVESGSVKELLKMEEIKVVMNEINSISKRLKYIFDAVKYIQ